MKQCPLHMENINLLRLECMCLGDMGGRVLLEGKRCLQGMGRTKPISLGTRRGTLVEQVKQVVLVVLVVLVVELADQLAVALAIVPV
jgi:hypothetical protein